MQRCRFIYLWLHHYKCDRFGSVVDLLRFCRPKSPLDPGLPFFLILKFTRLNLPNPPILIAHLLLVRDTLLDIFISGRVDYGLTPPSLRGRSSSSVTLSLWLRPLTWAHTHRWSSRIVDVWGVCCDIIHNSLDLTHLTGLDSLLIIRFVPSQRLRRDLIILELTLCSPTWIKAVDWRPLGPVDYLLGKVSCECRLNTVFYPLNPGGSKGLITSRFWSFYDF